ncbi:MAG TPA: DUF6443 domain-containing protein [Flavobacterium sp.]|uniref:DUF6443 domain-containing protein n=1 Tax=Flavobacterium sp. TaxID=239 RepID=UPI002DB81868|nr:DUF6443 domain-containing protein [Flavobacterium sp.]HEU4788961.1 DUF6443 domain-containing protein [Flavobacterium sp.]
MKKLTLLLLSLFPILVFSQTQTENYIKSTTYLNQFKGTYANYSQSLALTDLIYSGGGGGGGSITITNNILTVSFSGSWSQTAMKLGTIKALAVTPVLPKIELGPILASGVQTGYFAKIENNNLIFYSPFFLSGTTTTLSAPIAGGAPGVSFNVSASNPYSCVGGGGGGGSSTLAVSNGVVSLNVGASWSSTCNLKLGNIVALPVGVSIANMELGIIKDFNGLETAYRAKIENNWLVYYASVAIPALPSAGSLSFTSNLEIKSESITYIDGLGRPKQNIAIKASPSSLDIVTHIAYDSIGRQKRDYLPYMETIGTLGSYRSNALVNTNNYYISNFAADINSAKPNPFSEKKFEASPLNRILQQAAPGNDWSLSNNHTVKFDYLVNTATDTVRLYKVGFVVNAAAETVPTLLYDSNYEIGRLYKTITKDENWKTADGNNKTTQEFKDKEGRLVLKRTFNGGIAHDTQYVYDDFGNLTYVLPPLVNRKKLLDIVPCSTTTGYANLSTTSFDQSLFSQTGGGGSVTVTIANNVLTVNFGGSYNASMLNGSVYIPTSPCALPDMTIGTISNGDFRASIAGGKLKFTSITGKTSTNFNSTPLIVTLPLNNTSKVLTALNTTILDDLAYQYRYDKYNRLVEKKLPGKAWEYIIYDKADRPILTQDGNLRTANKWLFTKYDFLGRPVYTGDYTNTVKLKRAEVQALADAATIKIETRQALTAINGTNIYYSNTAFPNATDINVFTINYYDDYNFDLDGSTAANAVSYGITPITNLKGLTTGTKLRVLDSSPVKWITNVTYYDVKGRTICNYNRNNFLDITATVKSNLDFTGKTVETTATHQKGATTPITIVDNFTYDHVGRLLTQKQKINAQVQEFIANKAYDNLGQLITKGVGGAVSNTSRLQTVDYTYNIRGWLKGINNVNAIGTDLFAFGINYNGAATGATPLYNGNISQTQWKTDNTDKSLKYYNYTYDALNRLTQATDNLNKFNETINYDKNGNITYLKRLGEVVGSPIVPDINTLSHFGVMDELFYYYDKGNRLMKVTDVAAVDQYGFKDDAINTTADTVDDYGYDSNNVNGNGNMTSDTNKGITAIAYNHLNLPTKITFLSGTIDYVYDAAGVKQQKKVSGITTDYTGGFVYENNLLQFFSQPEGYVANNAGIFSYIYQYKDHLGNVRLSYADRSNDGAVDTSEIVEENNYYPFGLKQKGYNIGFAIGKGNATAQKYKYNGKELQDELGLNVYDYQARIYDPAAPHFWQIDPLAEKMRRWSPYSYAFDNPIIFTDPDGMEPFTDLFNLKGKKIGTDGVDNGVKMVVTDKKEAKEIAKTEGNIDLNNVKSGVTLPSDAVLKESLNVLDRHIKGGGLKEESSIVTNGGTAIRGETGPVPTIVNNVQTAPSTLPKLPIGGTPADVEATIHAHPTTVQQVGNQIYPQSASTPSSTDHTTFSQYNTNIIVGPLGTVTSATANPDGSVNIPHRANGAAIYNGGNSTPRVELEKRAIENILKN